MNADYPCPDFARRSVTGRLPGLKRGDLDALIASGPYDHDGGLMPEVIACFGGSAFAQAGSPAVALWLADVLRAYAGAPEALGGPIHTAPKDGRVIRLWAPGWPMAPRSVWNGERWVIVEPVPATERKIPFTPSHWAPAA